MNILVLGDVIGPMGVKAVKEKLPKIIKEKNIDFVIVNGENAADILDRNYKKIQKIFLLQEQMLLHLEIIFGMKKKQWNL